MSTCPPAREVFIASNFLDTAVCADLIAEARLSTPLPAQVSKAQGRIDLEMRRTSRLFISVEQEQQINRYLQELKPQLESHFQVALSGVERFQFLLYREGDFYKRHADRNERTETPDYIKARQISIVIFLDEETRTYTGGTLVIWNGVEPLRVRGETGKVVAFPSDLIHEVETVRSGERYSIVSWFL